MIRCSRRWPFRADVERAQNVRRAIVGLGIDARLWFKRQRCLVHMGDECIAKLTPLQRMLGALDPPRIYKLL